MEFPKTALVRAKDVVLSKKTTFSFLAVSFVLSFASMIMFSVSADNISKSSCGATDAKAKVAYVNCYRGAIVSAIKALVEIGIGTYLIVSGGKKAL